MDTLPSGTVSVHNTPLDPDAPPEGWTVREIFRLGSRDGSDETTLFRQIRDVEVDEEGRVYVLDRQAPAIRVFGRDGQHIRDIGGPLPGAGPGEFRDPRAMFMGPGGRLWVMDLRNRRYTVFELDGTLAETHRRTGSGGNPVLGTDGKIGKP